MVPVPRPSTLTSLLPQQSATPALVSAQVCRFPASKSATVSWIGTRTGTVLSATESAVPQREPQGCAIWPLELLPQHHSSPSAVRPHACRPPIATLVKRRSVSTAVGSCVCCWYPFPSWPPESSPQQYARPSASSAQAELPPASMLAKVSPPVTATGWGTRGEGQ